MKTDREFLEGIYEKARILEADRLDIEKESGAGACEGAGESDKLVKLMTLKETEKLLQLPLPRRNVIPMRGIAATAAAFAVVFASGLFLNKSVPMEIPQGYQEIALEANSAESGENAGENAGENESEKKMLRSAPVAAQMLATAPESPISQAMLICTAEVGKIEKSMYDEETQTFTTAVRLKPIETIKGKSSSLIVLTVEGGYDKKTKTFQEYEETFEVNEKLLLFLEGSDNGTKQANKNAVENSYVLLESAGGKYTLEGSGEGLYQNAYGTMYDIVDIKAEVALLSGSAESSMDNPVVGNTK